MNSKNNNKNQILSKSSGWFSLDFHSHFQHGENDVSRSLEDVKSICLDNNIDFFGIGQDWGMGISEAEEACSNISDDNFHIFPSPELPANYYRGNVAECLGHACVLGVLDEKNFLRLKELSANDYEIEKKSYPNSVSFAIIREAGCLSAYTHPLRCWNGYWGGKSTYPLQEMLISNMASSLPFDTICGPFYDAIDIVMGNTEALDNELALKLWCNLLNEGYRVSATGSSDCCFDRAPEPLPGNGRTYVYCDSSNPTLADIQEGVREMRCLATNGPLLSAEINEKTIAGMKLAPALETKKLQIRSFFPEANEDVIVELIKNGNVMMEFKHVNTSEIADFAIDIDVSEECWYAVRTYDSSKQHHAVLNPLFVERETYHPPEPLSSKIDLKIFSQTGERLSGIVEILNYGLEPEPILLETFEFTDGNISIQTSPANWLNIKVPGYQDIEQCIFFAEPIFKMTRELTKKDLTVPEIFSRFRDALTNITLEFRLCHEK